MHLEPSLCVDLTHDDPSCSSGNGTDTGDNVGSVVKGLRLSFSDVVSELE